MTKLKSKWWMTLLILSMPMVWGSSRTSALTNDPLSRIERALKRGQVVSVHPFRSRSLELHRGSLDLLRRGQLDLDESVRGYLRHNLLSPLVQIRKTRDFAPMLHLRNDLRSVEYRFYVADTLICDYRVRAHSLDNGEPLIMGRVPVLDPYDLSNAGDWPGRTDALETVLGKLASQGSLIEATPCLMEQDGRYHAAWEMTFFAGADDLPYFAIVGNQVFHLEERYFQATTYNTTGSFRVYEFNDESDLVDVEISNLSDDGDLETEHFLTTTSGTTKASASDGDFTGFGPTDSEFPEIMTFVHAELHRAWFADLGFDWGDGPQMHLKVHERPGNSTNNALYKPLASDGLQNPTIFLGDGCCSVLESLPIDSDVVRHEFGHHIVYQNLKSTDGESLVLHEGLADFFAMSHSDDDCLGESICPEGSPAYGSGGACWLNSDAKRCLRTADNTLKLTDSDLPKEAHLKSQMISGLLFDLRKVIDKAQVTQMTYSAVGYLVEDSGYRDFILALFAANNALGYDSGNICKIYQVATDGVSGTTEGRGFNSYLSDVDCSDTTTLPEPAGATEPIPQESSSAVAGSTGTTTKKSSTRCAMLTLPLAATKVPYPIIVLLPMLLGIVVRRRSS